MHLTPFSLKVHRKSFVFPQISTESLKNPKLSWSTHFSLACASDGTVDPLPFAYILLITDNSAFVFILFSLSRRAFPSLSHAFCLFPLAINLKSLRCLINKYFGSLPECETRDWIGLLGGSAYGRWFRPLFHLLSLFLFQTPISAELETIWAA